MTTASRLSTSHRSLLWLCLWFLSAGTVTSEENSELQRVLQDMAVSMEKLGDYVTVRIPIDTTYNDSEESMATLQLLTIALPPRIVQINSGETISAAILSEYRFGFSNLPKSYKLLEEHILELNGLTSDRAVQPGPLLIPTIPKRALTDPAPDNPNNVVPKIALAGVDPTTDDAWITTYRELERQRLGAAKTSLEIVLSRDQADILDNSGLQYSLLSGLIVVDFSNAPAEDGLGFRVANLAAIREFAKSPPKRRVPLYIVDTGWPNVLARDRALAYMQDVINSARQNLGLATISLPTDTPFLQPHPHCNTILASLEDYESSGSGVDLIFLPLSDLPPIVVPLVMLVPVSKDPASPGRKPAAQAGSFPVPAACIPVNYGV